MADAWAYGRFSSDNQDENTLDAQFKTIDDVARQRGDEIKRRFQDAAISGCSAEDRPGFMEMLSEARAAKIRPARICVYKLSRFMRNHLEALLYKNKFAALGIELISATEPLPEDKLNADLMENMILSINQYQSGLIGAQSLAGTKQIVRNGYWSGGPPPFGYRIVQVENTEGHRRNSEIVMRSKLEINEEEAAIVRRIFELSAATKFGGQRIYEQLCEELGHAVLGRKNKPLNARGVNAILCNPIYKGQVIYNDLGYKRVHGDDGEDR